MMIRNLTETKLNFEQRRLIGGGGEAEVYEAFDPQLNSIIAVKKIPIANFQDANLYFEESRKLYLTNHHNIVKINYACQDDDYIYLSMPFYQRGALKSLIDQRYLTTREIIRYSLQFLSGLNNIHSKGLIHFDIKPENVLINDSNQAIISDFGLAQYTGQYGFAQNFGTTPVLAPPELFAQPLHNLKFDIYQAGLTMYRLCNGDADFFEQINKAFISKNIHADAHFINNVIRGIFPNRTSYHPHIPRALRKVIAKALKVDPNERYTSVIHILNDLSKISTANDWQYSVNGNTEEWTKPDYIVTCVMNGTNYEIISLKGGRRKTAYCKTVPSLNDKNVVLYECLNEDW